MEKIDNKIKYEGELDLNGLKIPCYVLEGIDILIRSKDSGDT